MATIHHLPAIPPDPTPVSVLRSQIEQEGGLVPWFTARGVTPAKLRSWDAALRAHTDAACARILPPLP
jgi:hypothetical protein